MKRTISVDALALGAALAACSGTHTTQSPVHHGAPRVIPASSIHDVLTSAIGEQIAFRATVDLTEISQAILPAELHARTDDGDPARPVVVLDALPGELCLEYRRGVPDGRIYCEGSAPLDGSNPGEAPTRFEPMVPSLPIVRPDSDRTRLTLTGLARHPGPVPVSLVYHPSNPYEPGYAVATLTLDLAAPAAGDTRALHTFAAVETDNARDGHGAFQDYLAHRGPWIYRTDPPDHDATDFESRRRAELPIDLYSMATGAVAVQEALGAQLLSGVIDPRQPADVPLAAIVPPGVPALPYEQWLSGRTVHAESAAALVPRDALYLRFRHFGKLVETLDLMDDWGTDLLHSIQVDARDSGVRERYREQLGLELTTLGRLFGDAVLDDVVLTAHDPFFKEGTDVTMLFHLRQHDVAVSQLQAMLDRSAARHHVVAQRDERSVAGNTVETRVSPDGRLRSYVVFDREWAIVSNSPVALARIAAVRAGREPALANERDFRYLRSLYPADSADEDGFLYLSEAFIRSMVSPAWKIANRRRLTCASRLGLLSSSAMAYRRDRGRDASYADLVREHYLLEDDLRCPEGGHYEVQGAEASCSVHGRNRSLEPLVEHLPLRVTDAEREEYQAFVDEYENVYREYFDPIAVRFRLEPHQLRFQVHALPLVESSAYRDARRWLGNSPVHIRDTHSLPETLGALWLSLDLSPGDSTNDGDHGRAPVYSLFPGELYRPGGTFDLRRWLVGPVGLHVYDDQPLFTVETEFFDRNLGSFSNQLSLAAIASAATLPMYLTVPLRDPELGRRALDAWLGGSTAAAGIERYVIEPYRDVPIRVLSIALGPFRIRLWSAQLGSDLLISTRRHIITELIDRHVDGAESTTLDLTANAALRIDPDAFDRVREASESAWQERLRHSCLSNLPAYALLRQIRGEAAAHDPDVERTLLGYRYYCPEGGEYRTDDAEGGVYCTVHGAPDHARQGLHLTDRSSTGRLLRSLHAVELDLSFSDQGLQTELRVAR